jgi:hypothetical protein
MVALLFGNKSVMVRLMVGLWSLWSGRGAFGKNEVTIATIGVTIGVTIALLSKKHE